MLQQLALLQHQAQQQQLLLLQHLPQQQQQLSCLLQLHKVPQKVRLQP